MNATAATPRTPTTITIDCPWCDGPLAIEDAFVTPSVRCDGCATSVDLDPVTPAMRQILVAA